jgi:HEPN domain-containing protein
MNEDAVRNWITKAENDLKIARDEMATDEPVTDMICFHVQQCCEKYLKLFLIFDGKEYPRSHSLALLIDRCALIDLDFQKLTEWRVHELTPYAGGIRYDEPFYLPTIEETKQAIELAEKVRSFVRQKLEEKGFKC